MSNLLDAALTVALALLLLCPWFVWLHWRIDHPRRPKVEPAPEWGYLTAEDRAWLRRHEALPRDSGGSGSDALDHYFDSKGTR